MNSFGSNQTMNPEDLEWEPPSEADMKLIEARRERSDQISKLMSGYLLKGYKMLGSVCGKCETILLQDRQGVNYCVACSELDSDNTKDDPVISESAAMSKAREIELSSAAAAASSSSASNSLSGATAASKTLSFARHVPSQPTALLNGRSQSEVGGGVAENSFAEDPAAPLLSMSSIDVQSYTAATRNNPSGPSTHHSIPPNSSSNSKLTPGASSGDSGISSTSVTREDYASGDYLNLSTSDNSLHVKRLIEKIHWSSQELQGTHSVEYSMHLCQLMKIAGEAIVALRNARV